METWKLGLVGRLWMLRLVRHGGGSAAEKVGGPAGGKPRCHLLLPFPRVCVCGGVRKRETKIELKELVFEEPKNKLVKRVGSSRFDPIQPIMLNMF